MTLIMTDLTKLTRQEKENLVVEKILEQRIRHLDDEDDLNEIRSDSQQEAKTLSEAELERRIKGEIGQIRFEKGYNVFVWVAVVLVILIAWWVVK